MTYNDLIQKAGRRIDSVVQYYENNNLININADKIDRIKYIDSTPLVGTAMSSCEITLKDKVMPEYFNVKLRTVNKVNNIETWYTYDLGKFYLKEEPTFNANKKTYLHRTYDNMIKSMVSYVAVNVNYPCTLYNYFIAVTTALGYTNNIASLPNGDQNLSEDYYDGLSYTYRDVLDDIAEANGVSFYITSNNEIKIATLGINAITIDDDMLKNKNIEFKEKYGPINTIVLSRSYETDVIYLEDQQSVTQNGRHEFKIIDNLIMNGNDRSYYLPAILNQLKDIEYYIYDTQLTGYGQIDKLQKIIFSTGGNAYNTYMFNNEITQDKSYKQTIYAEKPENTNTDYTFANEVEQQIENASIMLNKKIGEVDIRGKTINLTADNIKIDSTHFKVTEAGDLTCNNATINGTIQKTFGSTKVTLGNPNNTGNALEIAYTDNSFKSYINAGNVVTYVGNTISTITGYGYTMQCNNTSGNAIFKADGYTGNTEIKKIIAGNIDCGTCTLSSSSDTQVNFNKTFANAPIVVLTCTQNNTGQIVYAGSVIATTTTNFTAFCMTNASSASNISFNWIAIGS